MPCAGKCREESAQRETEACIHNHRSQGSDADWDARSAAHPRGFYPARLTSAMHPTAQNEGDRRLF